MISEAPEDETVTGRGAPSPPQRASARTLRGLHGGRIQRSSHLRPWVSKNPRRLSLGRLPCPEETSRVAGV